MQRYKILFICQLQKWIFLSDEVRKEEELKGLKAELAALDRKIQLELAPPTEKECKEEEKNTDNVEVVANADICNKHQHFSKVKI